MVSAKVGFLTGNCMGAMPCPPRGETLALIAALAVGDREHTVLKKPFASHRVYLCAGAGVSLCAESSVDQIMAGLFLPSGNQKRFWRDTVIQIHRCSRPPYN
jgi:hypothetical protein